MDSFQWGAFCYRLSPNLGDEIQTLAALQYLPRTDRFLDRDHLQQLEPAPKTGCFFNGWFKHGGGNWPPPDFIEPHFVSFFATPSSLPELINPSLKAYYARFAPIGCRSLSTVKAFQRSGVEAYFSGCLTLTLDRPPVERSDRVLIVDVDPALLERWVPQEVRARAVFLSQLFQPELESPLAVKVIRRVHFRTGDSLQQSLAARMTRSARHYRKLKKAADRLKLFASAGLVITGRLHVALPCLALGTPVLFLYEGFESDPRLSGLHPLLRIFSGSSDRLRFDWGRPGPNSDAYSALAKPLESDCLDWISRRTGRPAKKRSWWDLPELRQETPVMPECTPPPAWSQPLEFKEEWKGRISKMASYIDLPGTVADFGCGPMWLESLLGPQNRYLPIDLFPRDGRTLVMDLNQGNLPPIQAEIAFLSGVLEYVRDVRGVCSKLCRMGFRRVILSYCTIEKYSNLNDRRAAHWVSHESTASLTRHFSAAYTLTRVDDFNGNTILVFDKKP